MLELAYVPRDTEALSLDPCRVQVSTLKLFYECSKSSESIWLSVHLVVFVGAQGCKYIRDF